MNYNKTKQIFDKIKDYIDDDSFLLSLDYVSYSSVSKDFIVAPNSNGDVVIIIETCDEENRKIKIVCKEVLEFCFNNEYDLDLRINLANNKLVLFLNGNLSKVVCSDISFEVL